MLRLVQVCLTLGLVLLPSGAVQAQTERPCLILFENLSRETINIQDVSVLQPDGTKKQFTGRWTFKPGMRTWLAGRDIINGRLYNIEGRQVFYTIELPDGVKSYRMSTDKEPVYFKLSWASLGNDDRTLAWISKIWSDDDFALLRANDKGRQLSKAEATYRYWNTVHGIQLEEAFDAAQTVPSPANVAGYLRTTANRIEDLETSGVDEDAVAPAKAYAALLRELVKVANGINIAKVGAMFAELYQLKVDSFTKMLDEGQRNAGKAEDIVQFMRSRRKALEKRYERPFPHLIPPVAVGLVPFTFSKGFYVYVRNVSGDDMKGVAIRYRSGYWEVKHQSVANRLVFSSSGWFQPTRVDPSQIKWRVEAGQMDHHPL